MVLCKDAHLNANLGFKMLIDTSRLREDQKLRDTIKIHGVRECSCIVTLQ